MFQFVGRFIQRKAAVARLEEAVRSTKRANEAYLKFEELDLRVTDPKVRVIHGLTHHKHDGFGWHWEAAGHRKGGD